MQSVPQLSHYMYLSKWLKHLFSYSGTDIHRELCLRQKTKEAKEKIFKLKEVGFEEK